LVLERLRYVDGALVMYVVNHLLPELAPAVVRRELADRSLYAMLRARCGVTVEDGRRTLEAVAAGARLAERLEVAPGSPVLFVESVSYDADGRPFECYRAWHRSDRARIEVRVIGHRNAQEDGSAT
jgi:GntR family transcriptional regulator